MAELIRALETKNYSIAYISEPTILGRKLDIAIDYYQKNNNLMSGHLTLETLDHLGVDINKSLSE